MGFGGAIWPISSQAPAGIRSPFSLIGRGIGLQNMTLFEVPVSSQMTPARAGPASLASARSGRPGCHAAVMPSQAEMHISCDKGCFGGFDIWRGPAGQALALRTTSEKQGLKMRRSGISTCRKCSHRDRCITGHLRRATRSGHAYLAEASRHGRAKAPS